MRGNEIQKVSTAIARVALLGILGCTAVFAGTVKVEGLIKQRTEMILTIQTPENAEVVVRLTKKTQVAQNLGALKVRKKAMPMSCLVTGLPVQVEGTYDSKQQLVAKSVRFNGDDLERAQSIQAGLHETQEQARKNQEELEKQNAELQAQNDELKKQQAELAEQQRQIEEHKAAIAANTARFGQLAEFYIWDEVTVYFGNNKTAVEPSYVPLLMALAQKAKTVKGYRIAVKGFASPVGNAARNQKLSEQRAEAVTALLLQQGGIPAVCLLAPAAMGEWPERAPVANDRTPEGQAKARRVVVRVLQNKGVAGIE
ncbi:MAG: OmpA family protein [Acidobacteria bacterium]|nr:OmpA family protein [Acidobacteriota bacterium]